MCEQGDIGMCERWIYTDNLGVRLGVDQAGKAVAGVAADAAALVGILFIEHDAERRVKRPQAETGEIVIELLHARLVADRRMRIRCAGWRFSGILTSLAVDLIKLLGPGVIRLQIFVREGPRRRDSAVVANLPEILSAEPEQGSAEKLRVAADVVVCVRVQLFAVPVTPHFLGLVLAFGIDLAWIPVVLLARHIVAAFKQQNAFTRRRQFVS